MIDGKDDDLAAIARELLALAGATADAPPLLELIDTGMSDAAVLRVRRPGHALCYLKVAADDAGHALRDEAARTRWLAGRGIRVPSILHILEQRGHVGILSEAMAGVAASVATVATPLLIDALARGLKALHGLPPHDCPFDETLPVRLARAVAEVAAGAVDPAGFDDRNHSIAPAALLDRLKATVPVEDIVVVHGDATLANIMIDDAGTAGFIDCGNAGRGDRMIDLALLTAEIEEHRGAEAAALFVSAYGAQHWDAAKARYFLDLYELF